MFLKTNELILYDHFIEYMKEKVCREPITSNRLWSQDFN